MFGPRFRHWLVGLVMVSPATSAFAQLGEDRLYRSPYYLGRGDTGISVADDEEAIFYNPAGIAQGKGIYKRTVLLSPTVEASEGARNIVKRLFLEQDEAVDTVLDQVGTPIHAGASNITAVVLRRAAIGAFISSQADILAQKSPKYGGLEMIQAAGVENTGLTFSLAEGFFGDSLYLGVTGKYLVSRGKGYLEASAADVDAVKEQLSDQSKFMGTGQGGGADVGLMWHGGGRVNPTFGLTVSDVGDTSVAPVEPTEMDLDIKQTVNLGVAVEPGTKYSKFRLLADYRDALGAVHKNPRNRTHFGGELTVADMIGVTAGLNQGYPCYGLYADIYILRVDVGSYTEELSEHAGRRPDVRYFLRIKAGF